MEKFTVNQNQMQFNDILHEDGSKTYDTVYGPIHIERTFVVDQIEDFLLGKVNKLRFVYLVTNNDISSKEYEQIMAIID